MIPTTSITCTETKDANDWPKRSTTTTSNNKIYKLSLTSISCCFLACNEALRAFKPWEEAACESTTRVRSFNSRGFHCHRLIILVIIGSTSRVNTFPNRDSTFFLSSSLAALFLARSPWVATKITKAGL